MLQQPLWVSRTAPQRQPRAAQSHSLSATHRSARRASASTAAVALASARRCRASLAKATCSWRRRASAACVFRFEPALTEHSIATTTTTAARMGSIVSK